MLWVASVFLIDGVAHDGPARCNPSYVLCPSAAVRLPAIGACVDRSLRDCLWICVRDGILLWRRVCPRDQKHPLWHGSLERTNPSGGHRRIRLFDQRRFHRHRCFGGWHSEDAAATAGSFDGRYDLFLRALDLGIPRGLVVIGWSHEVIALRAFVSPITGHVMIAVRADAEQVRGSMS